MRENVKLLRSKLLIRYVLYSGHSTDVTWNDPFGAMPDQLGVILPHNHRMDGDAVTRARHASR